MFLIARNQKLKGVFTNYFNSRKLNSNDHSSAVSYSSYSTEVNKENLPRPPAAAKVVICGGGLIGTSVAYHLAELGYKDVVLLTRDTLGSGTTYYSTGVVGVAKHTLCETLLSKYSANLYQNLQKKGHQIKLTNCGSIGLSTNRDRWHTIKRQVSETRNLGIDCKLLSAEECYEKFPYLRTDDLEGGVWNPMDSTVSPIDLLNTFANEARQQGIQIFEHCEVSKVLVKTTRGGQYCKVQGVETSLGTIECDIFVNCAGIRAREIGKLSKPRVIVPVHTCEHYQCVIKPFGISPTAPIIRDYDGNIYMRPNAGGGLVFGGFDKEAKPIFHEASPVDFENKTFKPDYDQFYPLLKSFIKRVPSAGEADVESIVNGPESFTPDTRMIMGESAEVDCYYVAAGANGNQVSMAGGIGRYTAELIAFGETDIQLWPIDVRRFVKLHNNRKFLRDRVRETVGKQYSLKYPTYGMSLYKTGRQLRTSPLHTRLLANGAVYGEVLGYERPLYFDKATREYYEDSNKSTFGKPPWFEIVRDEYMACRKGVAIMDMSSFTKFELKSAGREVVDFLQNICSNDIDSPLGNVIHTGMQNHKGGYENDCSVVQLEPNNFMIISPVTQQTRSMKWLKEHFPEDGSVLMSDITSLYAAINLVGPKAIELLSELTDEDLSTQNFPRFTCKEIDVGYASGIKAMRLTHTGEDGFILYTPTEYALHVYDILMEKGRNFGILNAGYYALRTLRIEKMYAFWGQDLDKNTYPYECGRDFRVKLETKDFIGKMALMELKDKRIKKRFVQLIIEDHDIYQDSWPWGGELIYRNGKFCGNITSTAYGFSLDKQVCLGFIHNFDEASGERLPLTVEYLTKNAHYEIDIAGKRYKAKLNLYPPNLNKKM